MAKIEGEIVIGRPAEEVFDFVADQSNEQPYAWLSKASRLAPPRTLSTSPTAGPSEPG